MKTTSRGAYLLKSMEVFVAVMVNDGKDAGESREVFLADAKVSDEPYRDSKKGPRWRTRFAASSHAARALGDVVGIGNESEATFCEEQVSRPKTKAWWTAHYLDKAKAKEKEVAAKRVGRPRSVRSYAALDEGLRDVIVHATKMYLDLTGSMPPAVSRDEVSS